MAVDLQTLVDQLASLDETSLVTVLSSVLQARPEAAPSVVSFAVPDLTYPPQRALVERRSNGTIKSYSEEKGFGFIACSELRDVFGNDVFLHASQLPSGCEIGMPVNFAVVLNAENKPQAYDLQPAVRAAKSGGKGKKGGAGDGWADFMMAMMGKGKSAKGKGAMGKGGKKGSGRPDSNVEVVADNLIGTIKSFNPTSGYGFIENPEVKAQYGGDAFLSHAHAGSFGAGDQVEFALFVNQQGKPQAKDLRAPGQAQAESWEAVSAAAGW